MRVLVTIPHYFDGSAPSTPDGRSHGSTEADPRPRVEALTACLASLRQLYGPAQHVIDHETRAARPANKSVAGTIDLIVCTSGDRHLLGQIPLPFDAYDHRPTIAEPLMLGFECHAVLREHLGQYDYYGYSEDDLICRDPWFFRKLAWFVEQFGPDSVLQPNRYEVGPMLGLVHKAYIDGDLRLAATSSFQQIEEAPVLESESFSLPLTFNRARNPHAGCFFLNQEQMERWVSQPFFLDRSTAFIGPLESAATLGLIRAFRVYKTSIEAANFLEIEHHGTRFLRHLRRRSDPPTLG